MIDLGNRWDSYDDDVDEENDEEEIEPTEEEEFEEEARFWGYRSRFPEKSFARVPEISLEKEKMMNNIITTQEVTPVQAVEEIKKICKALMGTPHYKKLGPEGIFLIVQKAYALNIDPIDAVNGNLYPVQGRVEMSSMCMNQMIRMAGHSVTKDKQSNAEICILHGKRKDNGDTWSASFSIDDAKQAGIYRNNWLTYPHDMVFARALSRLARQLFPDVIKGCYVKGEIQQSIEAEIATPEIIVQEVEMTIAEIKEVIENNIDVPHKEHLDEYLTFCRERVQKPMREVVESWLRNPDPFKNHYSKWVSHKILDKTIPEDENKESEPLEGHA